MDKNLEKNIDCIPKIIHQIPKIIHQIWIGPHKRPDMWMDTFKVDFMKKYDGWEYKLWTDDNIEALFKGFEWIKRLYWIEETYNGKSDILRYLMLYHHGGIYIDADSVWVNEKDLGELISQTNETNLFVAYEDEKKDKICGGVMGSTKHNSYILAIIHALQMGPRTFRRAKKNMGASKLLGPGHIKRCVDKFKTCVTVFPHYYFYPITWFGVDDINMHKKIKMPKESYMFQYGYSTNKLSNKIDKT